MPSQSDPMDVIEVAGVPLFDLTPLAAARHVAALASAGEGTDIHLINAYTISLVDVDVDVRDTILSASVNFADGKPLTWAARLVHRRSLHQVPGPELFEDVIAIGHEYGLRHYLLGSTDDNLVLLRQRLAKRYPKAEIVGTHSPPFRAALSEEVTAQDQRVRDSGANIVWIGLGTPKQDLEAARLARSIGVTAVCVGAAFDFSAGTLRRAPHWMRRAGLEWLFRFAMEPRRLWRRYTAGSARFIRAVIVRNPRRTTSADK